MDIKQKLNKLNYLQLYKLWDLWKQQNQESPNESAMIDDLLELVADDVPATKELLDDADNVDKPTEAVKLLEFLAEQYKEYQENILPFYAESEDLADAAKDEFLESLWDVIQQHFDDQK